MGTYSVTNCYNSCHTNCGICRTNYRTTGGDGREMGRKRGEGRVRRPTSKGRGLDRREGKERMTERKGERKGGEREGREGRSLPTNKNRSCAPAKRCQLKTSNIYKSQQAYTVPTNGSALRVSEYSKLSLTSYTHPTPIRSLRQPPLKNRSAYL